MDVALGETSTVREVPETTATTAPLVNVTSTDDAVVGVLAPMTTTALVETGTVHDAAAVPELGAAPTLAVHAKPGMKLAPDTVMVLPT
jgi:hypothetical protein